MTIFLEKRLADQIQTATDTDLIEAVIVVQEQAGPAENDGGLAQQVVNRITESAGEVPQAVRYFPRANAAVVTASRRWMEAIVRDENVIAASTTTVEAFPFSAI